MRNTLKFRLPIAILSLLVLHSCSAPVDNDKNLNQWIDREVTQLMETEDIPAISIGVIKEGEIFLSKGYGQMNREDTSQVSENSIYQIASQSKTLTGIIVKNLIHEGKVDPEEPISTYLSDILTPEAAERLSSIKMKNVLQHTSGISNEACSVYRDRQNGEYWLHGYSEEELIRDLNNLVPSKTSGGQWDYSNSGYAIVGYICERVSGMKYQELLSKYVSNRYNLSNTITTLSTSQRSNLVTPYRPSDRTVATRPSDMGMATPGSAVYSTVSDLSTILLGQLTAYRNEEKKSPLYLTEDVAETSRGENFLYGYGLIVQIGETSTTYGHGGDADGFGCEYFFLPKENIALVVLSSSGGDWMQPLAFKILDKLQGKTSTNESMALEMLSIVKSQDIETAITFFEKEKDSDNYIILESEMNSLGYKLLNRNMVEEAIQVFKLSVAQFPNSFNVYDSLGEAYLKNGNTELGIVNYKKSIELDPSNTNATDIVRKHTILE